MGRVGVVTHRERHDGGFNIVHIKDAIDNAFATRESNVFVIGKEKPWISLPKGKGVKVCLCGHFPSTIVLTLRSCPLPRRETVAVRCRWQHRECETLENSRSRSSRVRVWRNDPCHPTVMSLSDGEATEPLPRDEYGESGGVRSRCQSQDTGCCSQTEPMLQPHSPATCFSFPQQSFSHQSCQIVLAQSPIDSHSETHLTQYCPKPYRSTC